ncbi:MAG: hypothetical protein MUE73_02725 [Planctomycetes bacterium]|jgi:ELWxxDGT repeat protein|nr:hypothetical protein [Planctomycetota bacterium]
MGNSTRRGVGGRKRWPGRLAGVPPWLVLLAVCFAAGGTGPAELLKDINQVPSPVGSWPTSFTLFDGNVYFTASSSTTGSELWRSDGTPGGTGLVRDINPGPPGANPARPTELNGALYFAAGDGYRGVELWKTDGTAAGTEIVKEIFPGSAGGAAGPRRFGTLLYFVGTEPEHGAELWCSDGTADGTRLVKDICPGPGGGGIVAATFMEAGGIVYFTANDGATGTELWRSDGTAAGTFLTRDIWVGTSNSGVASLTAVGSQVFFVAEDGTNGKELWRSDGTPAGTVMVANINPGTPGATTNPGSSPANLKECGGFLFFTANDGVTGAELWRSDGSPAGTLNVLDIRAGAQPSSPANLTNVAGRLLFLANDGTRGIELWTSDGTAGGTVLVKDIRSGALNCNGQNLTCVNGLLYLAADDGTNGREPWRSDGTAAGTYMLANLSPGMAASNPAAFQPLGSDVVFTATTASTGSELFRSDGTTAGTVLVADIFPGAPNSNISSMTALAGGVWFSANDGVAGVEPWVSDGTATGTVQLANVYPDVGSSSPNSFTALGDRVFFAANDGAAGSELWSTDGTEGGTALLKELVTGFGGGNPQYLTALSGLLFFGGNHPAAGFEAWVSDGSADGTVLLADTITGSDGGGPGNFLEYRGAFYFTDRRGGLWTTDGTPANTKRVRSIAYNMYDNISPKMVTAFDRLIIAAPAGDYFQLWTSDGTSAGCQKIFTFGDYYTTPTFFVGDGIVYILQAEDLEFVAGIELWATDGTKEGTRLVKDIYPGFGIDRPNDSYPSNFAALGGKVYFSAMSTSGRELWCSDGTEDGTVEVKDIAPGAASSNPGKIVACGDLLLFVANDQIHGAELFRSDGTEDGTVLVRDIREGAGGACGYSSNLAALPEGLGVAFPAFTEDYGIEIWVSDGSARNTCRVTDAVEGTGSLLFSWMTLAGDRLFLSADDGVRGYEPWMVKTSDLGRVIEIDVKPGGGDNPINRKSRGSIPVAILSTDDFDAPAEVDPDSLTFGHTGFEESLVRVSRGEKDGDHDDGHDTPYGEDVDGDGDLDLVCHFATDKTDFDKKDTQGILRGHTKDGAILRGADKVCIVK